MWLLAGLLAALMSAEGPRAEGCGPVDLIPPLRAAVRRLARGESPMQLLKATAKLVKLYGEVSREVADAQPEHLSCVLAEQAGAALENPGALEEIVESYRNMPDAAFASMVLIGVFRRVSDDRVLATLFDRYHAKACATPQPSAFDRRVAGDVLTGSSDAFREKFLEETLRLYGPGSGVHYKIEAVDCRFLVDRALAQDAAAMLPEQRRSAYQGRLSALYR